MKTDSTEGRAGNIKAIYAKDVRARYIVSQSKFLT